MKLARGTKAHLNTSTQKFKGQSEGQSVKGTCSISFSGYNKKDFPEYPYKVTDSLMSYLRSDTLFPVTDTLILRATDSLTSGLLSSYDIINSLFRFVSDEVVYELVNGTVSSTFMTKKGNAENKAMLLITMLRQKGLPARLCGGLLYSSSYYFEHHWVEVWTGRKGWVQVDPTTARRGFFLPFV